MGYFQFWDVLEQFSKRRNFLPFEKNEFWPGIITHSYNPSESEDWDRNITSRRPASETYKDWNIYLIIYLVLQRINLSFHKISSLTIPIYWFWFCIFNSFFVLSLDKFVVLFLTSCAKIFAYFHLMFFSFNNTSL